MDTKDSTRISWLDTARSIAILLVILCHVSESEYFFGQSNILDRSTVSQFFGFFLFTLGRLSVPLFLFISGYLLLPRSYDTEKSLNFYKHNLLPLFVASEIWIITFYTFTCYFNSYPFSFSTLIRNMLFLGYEKISYLWYLPTIIGLYLYIPFFAIAIQKINIKITGLLLPITFLYCFFIPTINILFASLEIPLLSSQLFLYFGGGVYGFYMLTGYLFSKNFFKKLPLICLLSGFLCFVLLTALFQMTMYHKGHPYTIWYEFALLPIAAMFLFAILQNYPLLSFNNCGKYIAKYSFGIYLVHEAVRMITKRYFPFKYLCSPLRVFLLCILTFLISMSIVSLFSKISIIKKYLFLIK